MAIIKVPYTYKYYHNSSLATWVDKFCHSTSSVVFVIVSSMLLVVYLWYCVDVLALPSVVTKILGYIAAALYPVLFIGSFFLGSICDKCKISERIAVWDINGRKLSKKAVIWIIVIATVLALPGIAAISVSTVKNAKEVTYHKTMYVLTDMDSVPVEGNLAVTYNGSSFSTQYLPKDWQAATPEEVRYILHCTEGEELVGVYGFGSAGGYQRWLLVEVVDRESGKTISSETFFGGNPPNSVSGEEKKYYGSYPSEEEISEWCQKILNDLKAPH